jgi:hypothetical protein
MPGTRAPAVWSVPWSLAAMLALSAYTSAPGPLAAVSRLAATPSTVGTDRLDPTRSTLTVLSGYHLDTTAVTSRRAPTRRGTLVPVGARR